MEVLLINPNRYRNPPVIPIGLEYLAHSLKADGFGARVIDLCFSGDPAADLEGALKAEPPAAVCLTVRNVDSVLYPGTEYFLPEIRGYIRQIRGLTASPVIIGGSALGADPRGILDYLGGDMALVGPGERTLPRLLKDLQQIKPRGLVVRGAPAPGFRPERGVAVDYEPYIREGGIAGFETHRGCSSGCPYCLEASTEVSFRDPGDVLHELRGLSELGVRHLHLCDSEFNEDPEFCTRFLRRMVKEGLDIRWTLYMRPGNFTSDLFELLRASGAYLVTLSADTFRRPPGYWEDIREMTALARGNGIRMCIDLLTGFPHEDEDSLMRALDFFHRAGPDDVVVNSFIRLYENLAITRIIEKDPEHGSRLIYSQEGSYLAPAFYNRIPVERLKELAGGEGLFRIAGEEKAVNYQKA